MNLSRKLALLPAAAALLLAACSDTANPVQPETSNAQPGVSAMFNCTASTRSGEVRCTDGAGLPGGVRGLIVGGQNTYVQLGSSNIQVGANTLSVDVTVTNLIPQPLGTTNGTTEDPAGVRVFFVAEPASTGTGTVSVANPDGVETFTAPDQPYYQYEGPLSQGSITDAKTWQFQFTPDVDNFTFKVLVSAAVQYPDGYVADHPYVLTLNPGESRSLSGTVYSAVGNVLPGAAIGWSSSAPGTASVSGATVMAGAGRGFAELTAVSGPRPGVYTTAISVCQATVVGNGTSLPSSISSTDCFSSYGSNSGRPTTSYYADLYRVTLAAGQTLTVTMDGGGEGLDTYLLLAAGETGFLVAANDDEDDIPGRGSLVIYTAPVSGVYVIEASTFGELATGDYTLGVTIS